ncbi:MAG TPA: penicillin acylase family protein [Vicinamibacterales bacterium]|nr:penicillin acylase family protein [Vicinamibacterales bacterium]
MVFLLAMASLAWAPQTAARHEAGQSAAWHTEAQRVTIVRDDWGIAHVHGRTDADAVFGMEYAQAEDDFNRVETNYINALGRLAETEGAPQIYRDLRMKLFIDPAALKKQYDASPAWLKQLMDAFAGGLNYYLATHPDVKPRVITHFEPWMALAFSEGSIGGDIERVNLNQLQAFYGGDEPAAAPAGDDDRGAPPEPTGSNGIAIGPKITKDHHALLLINPHTSFFFRSELQMASDEGLDAYGAVTWGQFFVYQGFNPGAGWMHTSSGVDAIDEYLETVVKKGDRYYYRYGDKDVPMTVKTIVVPYKDGAGMAKKTFTVYYTQHGPVVRKAGDKWVTIRLMQEPLKALEQSYSRTKARNYQAFRKTMELHTNSSNNTIFADTQGNIAYFHANFIPRRDPQFDWTKPVDGSNPATDWHGVLSVDQSPNLLNPATGWLYNSNNWPWSAAGPDSPKKADFPAYVETGREESPRGRHALRVLPGKTNFTLDSLLATAFDSYLPSFGRMIPPLVKAWDGLSRDNPLRAKVAAQIDLLRNWDDRWGVSSVPTALAVFWGEAVEREVGRTARSAGVSAEEYVVTKATPDELLQALVTASDKLTADFGTWKTPWGNINRFQRINDDIEPHFDDAQPSIPVGFTSSRWGSLASFGARAYPNTKKWYGTSGNSFVAVVEFGDRIHARAITAGGESGHVGTPHFNDEAERYSTGNLREVYFYPDQLKGHTERTYHPGE